MISKLNDRAWKAWDAREGMDCHATFTVMPNRRDHADVIREVWNEDVYQMESLEYVNRTVIDIGAHIGSVTVRAALLGADVVAIEPFSEASTLLKENILNNGVEDRVDVICAAFSDEPVTMARDGDTGMGLSLPGDGPHITPSGLLEMVAYDDIALIKIDIEGWEHELFTNPHPDLVKLLGMAERVTLETHPHDGASALGTILETLLHTHSIQAGGDPDVGGYIHAYRY